MTGQSSVNIPIKALTSSDLVKSCKYIETGTYFALEGVRCCVHANIASPVIITADEIRNNTDIYDLVVQRRRDLFAVINGMSDGATGSCLSCDHLKEKKFKDVNFEYLGGEPLPGGMGIQHFTQCNERCTYCFYTRENKFIEPQYDILGYLEQFRKKGKLRGNNWIDFSGGEPALLKNLDEILSYFLENKLGTVVVYSNAVKYSQSIYDALKKNKVILTTSLDTGLASTYKKLRGVDAYSKVLGNLIRYRNSGTSGLWLKYVICDVNRTEDDLWSFITAVLAIKPDKVMICPDFVFGEKKIPDETVAFAARLWYLLENFTGFTPVDYTTAFKDLEYEKYRADLKNSIQELKRRNPLDSEYKLKERSWVRSSMNRMIIARDRLLHSSARERILPNDSVRLRFAKIAWSKTFGRIPFLRA
jgi:MoaA/NifB/PqqE/SkfB family radical SAM enzyme